jgi:hypothetical protein
MQGWVRCEEGDVGGTKAGSSMWQFRREMMRKWNKTRITERGIERT